MTIETLEQQYTFETNKTTPYVTIKYFTIIMSVDYSVMSRASKSFYAFQRNQEMANMRKSFHSMLYQ